MKVEKIHHNLDFRAEYVHLFPPYYYRFQPHFYLHQTSHERILPFFDNIVELELIDELRRHSLLMEQKELDIFA